MSSVTSLLLAIIAQLLGYQNYSMEISIANIQQVFAPMIFVIQKKNSSREILKFHFLNFQVLRIWLFLTNMCNG